MEHEAARRAYRLLSKGPLKLNIPIEEFFSWAFSEQKELVFTSGPHHPSARVAGKLVKRNGGVRLVLKPDVLTHDGNGRRWTAFQTSANEFFRRLEKEDGNSVADAV